MAQMKEFLVGTEIECIVNSNEFPHFKIGSYHRGSRNIGMTGWKSESDGSLSTYSSGFSNPMSCEQVMEAANSKNMFFKRIASFKKFFSKNGTKKFNEVLCINSSCGNHIHLSIKDFTFSKKMIPVMYDAIRDYFFDKIKTSTLLSQDTKDSILHHYFRSYAKKFSMRQLEGGDRRTEFNFSSERDGKGIEWRSLNLNKVKSWGEFDEMFRIIWDCIERIIELAKKHEHEIVYSKSENRIGKELNIPAPKLKRIFEAITHTPVKAGGGI